MPAQPHDTPAMRLDKWLWAARFYKTRSLAVDEIQKGRVEVNGHHAKPSRDVRVGDTVVLRQQGGLARTVQVLGLSAQAPIRIMGAHHIRKSYPMFFRHLESLGARFEYPEATRA